MAPRLSEDNELSRMQFAMHCLRELRNSNMHFHLITFSDEYLLLVSGRVNKQNCRIGDTEPLEKHFKPQETPPTFMVCSSVSKDEVTG